MTFADCQKIITEKGHAISALFFRPEGDPKALVLIVPAMGTNQKYYAPFATWQAYLLPELS
jgi:predicted alpha/beta hydrolase